MEKTYRIKSYGEHEISKQQQNHNFSILKSSLHTSLDNYKLSDKKQIISSVNKIISARNSIQVEKLMGQQVLEFQLPKNFPLTPKQLNRVRSKTVPDSICPKQKQANKMVKSKKSTNQTVVGYKSQYISQQSNMVKTKQKLLKLKHNLSMNKQGPILQTIYQSINDDKTLFTRKMKSQLQKKGNYSLIYLLQPMKTKNNYTNLQRIPNLQRITHRSYHSVLKKGHPENQKKLKKDELMQNIKKRLKDNRKKHLKAKEHCEKSISNLGFPKIQHY